MGGDEYVVRYGSSSGPKRSDYMNAKEAAEFYDKIQLGTEVTWKEILYEPLDDEERQDIVRSEEVKVLDLGLCKIAVPQKA